MQSILHLQIFWLISIIAQQNSISTENAQGRSSIPCIDKNPKLEINILTQNLYPKMELSNLFIIIS